MLVVLVLLLLLPLLLVLDALLLLRLSVLPKILLALGVLRQVLLALGVLPPLLLALGTPSAPGSRSGPPARPRRSPPSTAGSRRWPQVLLVLDLLEVENLPLLDLPLGAPPLLLVLVLDRLLALGVLPPILLALGVHPGVLVVLGRPRKRTPTGCRRPTNARASWCCAPTRRALQLGQNTSTHLKDLDIPAVALR